MKKVIRDSSDQTHHLTDPATQQAITTTTCPTDDCLDSERFHEQDEPMPGGGDDVQFNMDSMPDSGSDGVEEHSQTYLKGDTAPDVTTLYLNDIGHIPLLTAEQEVLLAREVALGSQQSKRRMIEANLRLVVAIAKRFQNRGLCLLDLIEEGNLGLIRAVEKYNPDLGYRFSTYATWWIKQSIDRALMNHGQTVRFPVHVMKDLQHCLRTQDQLRELLGREPSAQEIAAKLGKPTSFIQKLLAHHLKCSSVDQHTSEDGESSVIDNLPAEASEPVDVTEQHDIKRNVEVWLGKLSQRHRDVVVRRFGLHGHDDLTLEEVGADVGITRERVRQLQLEALGKLKRMLERDGFRVEHLRKQ